MKYKEKFEMFLKEDENNNYYYKTSHINILIGKNNDNYYEIFIDNANEIEDKESIIIERFFYYLDEKKIDYSVERLYNSMIEFINVYDSQEYIGSEV